MNTATFPIRGSFTDAATMRSYTLRGVWDNNGSFLSARTMRRYRIERVWA